MKVKILREAGYEEAQIGLALSWDRESGTMPSVMKKLYCNDGGHNKFLESLVVWIDMTCPRYFWQQFDTYRVGVTKQSGSTMHTLMRRQITQDDFEEPLDYGTLCHLNLLITEKAFTVLKNELPEGFLQRRIVCTNYKALRNIIAQRQSHRLPQWGFFCREIMRQVEHPEFFGDLNDR